MPRKSLAIMLLAFFSGCTNADNPPVDFVAQERIGGLRIGGSEAEARKAVDCPLKRGEGWDSATLLPAGRRLFGPVAYHEGWENVGCGIKIGMVGKKGGPLSIESIGIFAPSTLGTHRGIRIGSTEQEVKNAYASEWNQQASEPQRTFVAGSVERGLIVYFANGRAIKILLQAKAD